MRSKWRGVGLIALGSIFVVIGVTGALVFHRFPMGILEITIWRDVLTFSGVAVAGLALIAFGVRLLRRKA